MKIKIVTIVIDADVAKSAGESQHPVSSQSRKLLQTIKDETEIQIFFNQKLSSEWKKHQSHYSLKWRASMTAKKRLINIQPIEMSSLLDIHNANISEKEQAIAEKDAHLIDLTLVTDSKLLASNDKTARQVFCQIAKNSSLMHGLLWFVPVADIEPLLSLLKQGGFVADRFFVSQKGGLRGN